jgi:hypothetical protein
MASAIDCADIRAMKIGHRCRSALVALAGLTLNLIGWAQDQPSAAQTFAESALKMFDAVDCSKMYDAFEEASRTLSRKQWIQVCSTTLKQRGRVIKRSSPNGLRSMGIYRFVFTTQCTEGKVFEDCRSHSQRN